MAWAETKTQLLNPLSHLGALPFRFFLKITKSPVSQVGVGFQWKQNFAVFPSVWKYSR